VRLVSVIFSVNDRTIWFPSSGVGHLYAESVRAAARLVSLPAGLAEFEADEYAVDAAALSTLSARLLTHQHTVIRALTAPTVAISLLLLERAGAEAPQCDDPSVIALAASLAGSIQD